MNMMKLSVGLPIVPFHSLPIKEWHDGKEKKPRIPEKEYLPKKISEEEDDDDDYESSSAEDGDEEEERGDDNDSDDGFNLMKHIESLLPGDYVDGKPTKAANKQHLEDLRPSKKKWKKINYRRYLGNAVKNHMEKQREKRKHHILREYEEKIKKYYLAEQERITKELEEQQKAVLLEAYRTHERIKKNSIKKVKKSKVIEEFTKDLARRDKETQQINFYVKTLSHWAHEHDQDKELEKRSIEEKQKQKLLQQLKEQEAIRKKLEDEQSKKLLEQEQRATEHIDTLMIRYGMKKFIKPIVEDQLEKADRIFRRSVQFKDEQNKRKSLNMEAINQSAEFNSSDINDNPVLQLTLRKDQEIIHEAHQEHRRNFLRKFRKNKRNRNATSYNLFNESIYSTGSVTILKGVNFGEVGGLSLAAELTRGLCPNMEALNLKGCGIGSLGVGQIIQGIKFANIMNLSVINLRGNFVQARVLDYMNEVCNTGIFMNLRVLILRDNELGDAGIEALIRIIVTGHFVNISEIHLQNNSVTDHAFKKVVLLLQSVHDSKCPNLVRLAFESNLITARMKRYLSPLPFYISC